MELLLPLRLSIQSTDYPIPTHYKFILIVARIKLRNYSDQSHIIPYYLHSTCCECVSFLPLSLSLSLFEI